MPDRILEAADALKAIADRLREEFDDFKGTQRTKTRLLTAAVVGVFVLALALPITVWYSQQRSNVKVCQAINQNRTTIRVVLFAAAPHHPTAEQQRNLADFYRRIGGKLDPVPC